MPLSIEEREALIAKAKEILNNNWWDGYTVPSTSLYPFQWLWDSGFIALGLCHVNLDRAKQELRSLFRGQWKNGMLPHIVFHREDPGYFPGPEEWQTFVSDAAPETVKTSGITQPPVLAFILDMMYQRVPDQKTFIPFIEELYPKILHFHQYLYTHRDPNNEGLIYIDHNWESGSDNSPLWDHVLGKMHIDETVANIQEKRRDTSHIDAAERPSTLEYQKYMYLVYLFRDCGYNDACIAEKSPFLVQDALMNSLLFRANTSLVKLGALIGNNTAEIQDWNDATRTAMNTKLWNPATNRYDDFDMVHGERIDVPTSLGLSMPLFAGLPDSQRATLMIDTLTREFADDAYYLCASFSPNHAAFEPKRYWRGPVWINTNWMLYHGLKQYNADALAQRVKTDTLALINTYGFHEYFNPVKKDGGGHGANRFSWSAALFLDLMHEAHAA